ncbi:DNA-directed RNA polymerase III subunit RPC6 [Galdieria sulphuraria]|uniref:DNA-directed RNA polymerase III subunit RPC6 n=1 Tax=Galdieria sulphuraria TaxID=130081 RepID=M2Y9V6_GALSU|nr:DNA-directed RNA polymerase III subunit C34 [Galdieria sulphuraria]EME32664.1 DNA-directed RNA polymerase III subunit C34 [Galdieria sulphuraria]GJD07867.1 DNA-directed RNA polymerase III subunit RPC6 [Galdieria sulphuraria]|eukprot:XP_005709184.1 DNA-directed RNA polymerase III subunit C34 [Galdieria sulphuraria]
MATDTTKLEEIVLRVASVGPHGVTDEEVRKSLPENISPNERLQTYNNLLQRGRLQLKKLHGKLFYQAVEEQVANKLQGLSTEERLVYSHVEEAGNKGIWTRDLRNISRLQQTQLTKILKNLELKKLVKPFKSVKSKNKKLYMLFDLEPSIDVTGGPWYYNQEFDAEFFDVLYQQSLRFIRGSSTGVAVEEVANYITSLGISKEKLEIKDFESLLQTMIYDGVIERICKGTDLEKSTTVYRYCHHTSPFATLGEVPCGICPVYKSCSIDGVISPVNCVYLRKWEESLEF